MNKRLYTTELLTSNGLRSIELASLEEAGIEPGHGLVDRAGILVKKAYVISFSGTKQGTDSRYSTSAYSTALFHTHYIEIAIDRDSFITEEGSTSYRTDPIELAASGKADSQLEEKGNY